MSAMFVFLPQDSKQYELLNYSIHGTSVNNVLYSCDFSQKSYEESGEVPAEVSEIKDMIKGAKAKTEIMASKASTKVCS